MRAVARQQMPANSPAGILWRATKRSRAPDVAQKVRYYSKW